MERAHGHFPRCSCECARQNVSARIPRAAHANDGQRPPRGVPETRIEDGWKKSCTLILMMTVSERNQHTPRRPKATPIHTPTSRPPSTRSQRKAMHNVYSILVIFRMRIQYSRVGILPRDFDEETMRTGLLLPTRLAEVQGVHFIESAIMTEFTSLICQRLRN